MHFLWATTVGGELTVGESTSVPGHGICNRADIFLRFQHRHHVLGTLTAFL